MSKNLGTLVQMIGTLGQLRNQQDQTDLQKKQILQQAQQFAKAGEERRLAQALEIFSKSSAQARQAMMQGLESMNPEDRRLLEGYMQNPQAASVSRDATVQAGTPMLTAPQQQEAAMANASGMNVGQAAQSQYLGNLFANAPTSQELSNELGTRTAAGRTVLEQMVASQNMQHVPRIAAITRGDALTAPQQVQAAQAQQGLALQGRQVAVGEANQELAQRSAAVDNWSKELTTIAALNSQAMQTVSRGGQLSPDDITRITTEQRQLYSDMNDSKVPTERKIWYRDRIRMLDQLISAAAGGRLSNVQPFGQPAPIVPGLGPAEGYIRDRMNIPTPAPTDSPSRGGYVRRP